MACRCEEFKSDSNHLRLDDAAQRPVYGAMNSNNMAMGSPLFGGITLILNRTYVDVRCCNILLASLARATVGEGTLAEESSHVATIL